MATPVANAVEWFGDQMYLTTAAATRSPVLTELTFNFGTY
jgi:hypothetical protein